MDRDDGAMSDWRQRALMLEADLHNERATDLYRRRGFKEHRRRLMRLDIGH